MSDKTDSQRALLAKYLEDLDKEETSAGPHGSHDVAFPGHSGPSQPSPLGVRRPEPPRVMSSLSPYLKGSYNDEQFKELWRANLRRGDED